MERLRQIVAFWRDCVASEGALEQSFTVSSQFRLGLRTRAYLFRGDQDPFIFAEPSPTISVRPSKLYDFITQASLKGQEVYFGYPLLMFYDREPRQHRVAPLFAIRLSIDIQDETLVITRAEATPTLGVKAFNKLGLGQEEIASLNAEVTEIFAGTQRAKLETILYLIRRETALTCIEAIDPAHLTTSQTVHPYTGTVVYNRALVYASEASVYNLHILNDLERLVTRHDIAETALDYLNSPAMHRGVLDVPVLPFAFDEYQLQAIDHIMGNRHTVVTGPPGTGKSQFIANLIVNLFLQQKRVLFVSHTGEAVRVVNERIGEQFAHLMMQTGKKAVRQDLGRRLAEMVTAYNDWRVMAANPVSKAALTDNWHQLKHKTAYLQKTEVLHDRLARSIEAYDRLESRTDLVGRSNRLSYAWRMHWLTRRIRRRHDSRTTYETIDTLKRRHVILSREYVRANYLPLIFQGERYGQLAAYIEAVQHRRPTVEGGEASYRYVDAALQAMNIWSCTLKSLAATFPLKPNLFDYVIFDEASQIDLPSAAPALYRARNMVVVGDANQLLHIAKISKQTEDDLARINHLFDDPQYPELIGYREASLFNSSKRALTMPEQQLRNHYRSHPNIANMFSSIFYAGGLRVRTPDRPLPEGITAAVVWNDVCGASYKHRNGSRYNPDEARAILAALVTIIPLARRQHLTIGIATPYAMQRERIAELLGNTYTPEELSCVRVLTVHQFQGSEVDILLLSTVVASDGDGGSDYWYMKHAQILNVAVSRARQALIIVGDRDFALSSQSKLRDIAEYCLRAEEPLDAQIPNRPMNVFELQLFKLLIPILPKRVRLEPQFVLDGRYTLDFAILSRRRNLAIELDGEQHEMIGGLPVYEDTERDAYLMKRGWQVIRVTVYELLKEPDEVALRVARAINNDQHGKSSA